MAPVTERPEKRTVARAPPEPMPVMWVVSPAPGTVWQALQAMGVLLRLAPVRCLAWAPTAAKVAAVLPAVSAAVALKPGATAFDVAKTAVWVRSPWQSVQPVRVRVTTPSTCVPWTTAAAVYPVPWQVAHVGFDGWCEAAVRAGGIPWQEVQARVAAVFQLAVAAPPAPPAKLPWQ
jgi:hypothetical protein